MKRKIAMLLRRLADRLDPSPEWWRFDRRRATHLRETEAALQSYLDAVRAKN